MGVDAGKEGGLSGGGKSMSRQYLIFEREMGTNTCPLMGWGHSSGPGWRNRTVEAVGGTGGEGARAPVLGTAVNGGGVAKTRPLIPRPSRSLSLTYRSLYCSS